MIQKDYGYIDFSKNITEKDFSIGELHYYPIVEISLKKLWESNRYEQNEFFLENTSKRDSKIIGQWTRPDFTLVSRRKFPFTIGEEFDVVTFEVKRPETSDVLAVFEALSHTSAATKAYVVFPIDQKDWTAKSEAQENRVRDECSKHGVGLILIESAMEKPEPLHIIKARRREIDHERTGNFLSAVLSNDGKERIAKWK